MNLSSGLRRSCHAVPATGERMIAKARTLACDMVFLDLEDSVAPEAKDTARASAVAALADGFAAPTVGVRVNQVGSAHCHRDIVDLVRAAGARLDVIVLPKVEGVEQVHFAHHLLTGLERESGLPVGAIGLDLQIETATGLRDAGCIAAACPGRVRALVVGPGDLAADLGLAASTIGGPLEGYPGDGWHAILVTVLVAARAAGVRAIDGPYARIDDADGLRASAGRARALGYDGKWSIHPSQIPVLHDVFRVPAAEREWAERVLTAHRDAIARGTAAALLDGEMIDEATRRIADRIIAASPPADAGATPPA